MSANNIVSFSPRPELRPESRPIELEIEIPGIVCLFRLTPTEARHTLALITPWPVTAPFSFQADELSVSWTLSPEGAEVFRDEITLQLSPSLR